MPCRWNVVAFQVVSAWFWWSTWTYEARMPRSESGSWIRLSANQPPHAHVAGLWAAAYGAVSRPVQRADAAPANWLHQGYLRVAWRHRLQARAGPRPRK